MRQKSVAKKCRQKSVVCARAFFQKSARAHMQNLQQRVRYTLVTLTQAKAKLAAAAPLSMTTVCVIGNVCALLNPPMWLA